MKHFTDSVGWLADAESAGWYDDAKGSLGAKRLKTEYQREVQFLRSKKRNNLAGKNDDEIAKAQRRLRELDAQVLEFSES